LITHRTYPNGAGVPSVPADQYVDRDPCGFCQTRRDIGCTHYPASGTAKPPEGSEPRKKESGGERRKRLGLNWRGKKPA
jgi:hypothetical protein